MANITLSISDFLKMEMEQHSEIKWSEIAKKAIAQKLFELKKFDLIRKHLDKEQFSEADLQWMDENDWHPVDERELRKEVVEELKKPAHGKRVTIKELLGK